MKIKICGINNLENLLALERLKPDYLGFIFYKKSLRDFKRFSISMLESSKKVGVFVNESISEIVKLQSQFQLNAIQLHGDESVDFISNLRLEMPKNVQVFKAISIINKDDLKKVLKYENSVEVIILDTKTEVRGGSGKKFDWNLLTHYHSALPFLLSGGIQPNDAEKVKKLFVKHPNMIGVDINSKFEISPGLKDQTKVENFIRTINKYKTNGEL